MSYNGPVPTVTLTASGKRFDAAADETVLEAAQRAGIALPYSCRGGVCGSCKAMLVEGECSYPRNPPVALSASARAHHAILLCQAVPCGDIAIQAREIAFGLRVEAAEVLAEIAAARRRVEAGTYGRCEVCAQAIDVERLEAVPWTRRCRADEVHREHVWRAAPAEGALPVWVDEVVLTESSREGSVWDPEDDHPTDATEEAALHELGGGA